MQEEAILATDCQAIQEFLTQYRGEIDRLDEIPRQHLEICPGCREVAAAERALGLIFEEARPPADPRIEGAVLAALGPVRIRRRIVAFMPVAASLLVALFGAVLVGGFPGVGVVTLLPRWSADGWMAFVTSASDWATAVAAGARASAAVLDPAILAGVGMVSFLGLVGVAVTALRWRKISPWRNDS